jgi:hypothetical protein
MYASVLLLRLFQMFIPSWVNEKLDGVSVNVCVWASGLSSFVGYIFIGLLCATTYGFQNFWRQKSASLRILVCPQICGSVAAMLSSRSLGVAISVSFSIR